MSIVPENPYGAADRIELNAVPLAVVRYTGVRIDDLREAFDASFPALVDAFSSGLLTPVGPALAVYHGDPMAVFDLEVGFPVAEAPDQPIVGGGVEITASALPAGPALATTHIGGYDGLDATWSGLVEEATRQGLTPAGILIDVYVSDPSTTADDALRTDLILPLAR